MYLLVHLFLLALSTALDVNCNDPTCLDVVNGSACYAAAPNASFAALVKCVEQDERAAPDPAAAVRTSKNMPKTALRECSGRRRS